MRYFISLVLASLGMATVVSGQKPSSKSPQEQIINLEKSFTAAIQTQDTVATKKFQTETFFLAYTVTGMPIQIVPRHAWLTMLKDYYVTESFSIDDIKVNVY